MEIKKMCLCCLKSGVEMKYFSKETIKDGNQIDSSAMIKIFRGIQLSELSTWTNYICLQCFSVLNSSYKFYVKCLETQKYWNTLKIKSNTKKPELPLLLPKPDFAEYKCAKCGNKFKSLLEFNNHIKKDHTTSEIRKSAHRCSVCFEKFKTRRELKFHDIEHLSNNICPFCCNIFFDRNLLKNHVLNNHQCCRYECNKCTKTYINRKLLLTHMKERHQVEKLSYFCSICIISNEYFSEIDLQNHVDTNHSKPDSNLTTVIDVINPQTDDLDMNEEFLDMNEEFLDEFFLNQDQDSLEFIENWNNYELSLALDYELNNDGKITTGDKTDEVERYKCPRCENKFKTQQSMNLHLAHDHEENVLVCSKCGSTFNSQSKLENHSVLHLDPNILKNLETKNFDSKIIVKKINDQTYLECKICGKKFVKKINFIKHPCKYLKTAQNIVKCPFCTEIFSSLKQMNIHRKTHEDSQTYECSQCQKVFKTSGGLQYHLKVHDGMKPFKCTYCDKRFIAATNLNAHIRTIHVIVKPHTCSLCDRKFATLDHLKKHVMSVHQRERNHLCSTCGKSFSQLSHLKQHNLIHTGMSKFKCKLCKEQYIKKSDLNKHMEKNHLTEESTE